MSELGSNETLNHEVKYVFGILMIRSKDFTISFKLCADMFRTWRPDKCCGPSVKITISSFVCDLGPSDLSITTGSAMLSLKHLRKVEIWLYT